MSVDSTGSRRPVAVREAIKNFVPRRGFVVVPKRDSETSFIFDWGVRVRQQRLSEDSREEDRDDIEIARDDSPDDDVSESQESAAVKAGAVNSSSGPRTVAWICLASENCRQNVKLIALPRGFTSKACEHLKKDHGIHSNKTLNEVSRKRESEDEFEMFQNSQMYRENPKRLVLLIETRRIVFHNLPFRFAEFTETMLLNRLTSKPDFQTEISIARIRHTIIEMYATAKREVIDYLKQNKVASTRSFSLVVDFWTSKVKKSKFLGLRVYLIDNNWRFKSILLGIREFNPQYGEREKGISGPFQRWIEETLLDFRLTRHDFFGSTTDGGADVLRMMQKTLGLHWHWCIPHMSNAATKAACGLHKSKDKNAKNQAMVDLISKMARTVYIVNSNEKTGSLWKSLCQMLGRYYRPPEAHPGAAPDEESKNCEEDEDVDLDAEPDDEDNESDTDDAVFVETMRARSTASHGVNKATKLLNFQSHRFLGLLRVIRRLLERWGALKEWFKEIERSAAADGKAPPYDFPLKRHNKVLVQLLSLLTPIDRLNRMAQNESANQVEVLLELYMLRLEVLDTTKPLPHYLSTDSKPRVIFVDDLKPVVARTRELLLKGFDKRFFHRYVVSDRSERKKIPFVPEMQLFLDPRYKNWELSFEVVVRTSCIAAGMAPENIDRHVRDLSEHIRDRVKKEMHDLAQATTVGRAIPVAQRCDERPQSVPASRYNRFAKPRAGPTVAPARFEISRVDDEFTKWLDDEDEMLIVPTKDRRASREETILEFWERKSKEAGYDYLPKVVRRLFSTPSSSAQIERDLGDTGMMVTKSRGCLSSANIEMAGFLKCNKEFVDITQVAELRRKEAENQKPRITEVDLNEMIDQNVDMLINDGLSSLNVSSETFEDFYRHGFSF